MAEAPELPGCTAHGETEELALKTSEMPPRYGSIPLESLATQCRSPWGVVSCMHEWADRPRTFHSSGRSAISCRIVESTSQLLSDANCQSDRTDAFAPLGFIAMTPKNATIAKLLRNTAIVMPSECVNNFEVPPGIYAQSPWGTASGEGRLMPVCLCSLLYQRKKLWQNCLASSMQPKR